MSPRNPTDSVFAFSQSNVEGAALHGIGYSDQSRSAFGRVLRFAEVPDQMAWKRRERLITIFGPVNFRQISSSSLDGIVQHDEAFDVIVCSVDDVARLRAALRPPADMVIRRKISFAYSDRSSPGRRAKLLKMGFDDVLWSSMTNDEIRLRFQAVVVRTNLYSELAVTPGVSEWEAFADAHVIRPLRRRQKDIVQALVNAKGGVVRYRDLANYDYALGEYNISSLKATISNIRKKLVNCEIVSVHGDGYRLVTTEKELA